jgi:predicted PhzF superfamily epimerase YddE/YHI9
MAKHRFVSGSGAGSIVFLQGVLVRRPSRLHVRVDLAGGDVKGVKVGGTAAVVGDGTMTP